MTGALGLAARAGLNLNLGGLSQKQGGGGSTTGVLAANRGQMPTALVGYPANTMSMVEHWASPEGDITDLVFTDTSAYINASFGISSADNGIFSKWVEYPQGTFTQVKYGGANTFTICFTTAFTVKSSDPVAVTIPAGARFWEHTLITNVPAGGSATIELPAAASTIGVTDTKYAYSGSFQHPAADASINHFGSVCITGTVKKTGARGFVIVGDSIAFGQNDIVSVGVKGGSGYLARGLDSRFPWSKITKGGMSGTDLQAIASTALNQVIAAMLPTDMINEFGGGDLRIGKSVAQVEAGYQSCYARFTGKRIGQTTVTPRTDSPVDNWVTVSGQTPKTDGNWAGEVQLNTDIRAGLANVAYYLETSDVACTARNSRIWTAPPAATIDGVHPNSGEAAILGEVVRTAAL